MQAKELRASTEGEYSIYYVPDLIEIILRQLHYYVPLRGSNKYKKNDKKIKKRIVLKRISQPFDFISQKKIPK